jgi:branched-chain amino acid transport system ATP-binding protein
MSALLELNDVEARYGPVLALRGVSLAVPEGAVVAVLGANGAGTRWTGGVGEGRYRPRT